MKDTATGQITGTIETLHLAPMKMTNTATRLRALERFVIEKAVEAEMGRQTPIGMLGRDRDDIRAELTAHLERRLGQLQDEEAIPWLMAEAGS